MLTFWEQLIDEIPPDAKCFGKRYNSGHKCDSELHIYVFDRKELVWRNVEGKLILSCYKFDLDTRYINRHITLIPISMLWTPDLVLIHMVLNE